MQLTTKTRFQIIFKHNFFILSHRSSEIYYGGNTTLIIIIINRFHNNSFVFTIKISQNTHLAYVDIDTGQKVNRMGNF